MTIERSPSRPLASALALGALLLGASCSKAPDARPSFLLISIDTLRADHVGCYGYERDTTPHLDALAARGYRFDQCATVSENTLISHASMFTGLTAVAHGTTYVGDGRVLHDNYRTIAEDFRDAGYQTAGFNSHGAWLNEAYGMAQGFETFVHGHDDADALLPKVEEWLAKRDRSKPFFVFLHLFDVHSDVVGRPYQAKPPHLGRWTSDYAGEFTDWETRKPSGSNFLNAVNAGKIELSPEDDRYLVDQYDEGLATLDERLGRFLDELDGDVKRTTWITVTSDHGEEFGEHGKYMHGTVFDGIQRVPLIVVPPEVEKDRLGPPRVLEPQVRIVEIRPTLASLAGLAPPAYCEGNDLVPFLAGESTLPPDCPGIFKRHALRYNGLKLIPPRTLFDLRADPGETANVATERAEDVDRMRARFQDLVASGEAKRAQVYAGAPEISPTEDPERRAQLEALGYLVGGKKKQGGKEPPSADSRRRDALLEELGRVQRAASEGDRAARERVEEIKRELAELDSSD
ncbi:MAG: sulfatase [Planctomycetota bacterium JB042]